MLVQDSLTKILCQTSFEERLRHRLNPMSMSLLHLFQNLLSLSQHLKYHSFPRTSFLLHVVEGANLDGQGMRNEEMHLGGVFMQLEWLLLGEDGKKQIVKTPSKNLNLLPQQHLWIHILSHSEQNSLLGEQPPQSIS
jgi:hypothetical protein